MSSESPSIDHVKEQASLSSTSPRDDTEAGAVNPDLLRGSAFWLVTAAYVHLHAVEDGIRPFADRLVQTCRSGLHSESRNPGGDDFTCSDHS